MSAASGALLRNPCPGARTLWTSPLSPSWPRPLPPATAHRPSVRRAPSDRRPPRCSPGACPAWPARCRAATTSRYADGRRPHPVGTSSPTPSATCSPGRASRSARTTWSSLAPPRRCRRRARRRPLRPPARGRPSTASGADLLDHRHDRAAGADRARPPRRQRGQLSVSRSEPLGRSGLAVAVTTPKEVIGHGRRTDRQARTTAATVGALLSELGVDLGPQDRVRPRCPRRVGKPGARDHGHPREAADRQGLLDRRRSPPDHPGRRLSAGRPRRHRRATRARESSATSRRATASVRAARPRRRRSPPPVTQVTAVGTKARASQPSPRRCSTRARPAAVAARPPSVGSGAGTGSPRASPAATRTVNPATATTAASSSRRRPGKHRRAPVRPPRRPGHPRADLAVAEMLYARAGVGQWGCAHAA